MSSNKSIRELMINIPQRDKDGKLHYFKNLEGIKFGKLTPIKYLYTNKRKRAVWLCKCDCGKEIEISSGNLITGNTKSCGCLHTEECKKKAQLMQDKRRKYKRKYEKQLAHVFYAMKDRCYNCNCKTYKNYGKRGVKIFQEWLNDFNSFYDWAINIGYEPSLSIDRIDVNGDYQPNNCRWITNLQQQNNKRNNKFISLDGEKHTYAEWGRIKGIPAPTIRDRVKRGWSPERILNTNYKRKV